MHACLFPYCSVLTVLFTAVLGRPTDLVLTRAENQVTVQWQEVVSNLHTGPVG